MTIKLVRGVVRNLKPGSPTNSKSSAKLVRMMSAGTPANAARGARTSEASVTSLKTARQSSSGERIRNSWEARTVAKGVAQRLRYEEGVLDAHSGVANVTPREHLVD